MWALVVGIIKGYEIDVDKIISKKIHNWEVSTYTTLAFPCLLTQICLNEGVQIFQLLINFSVVMRMIDLGLSDIMQIPIPKAKLGAILL